MEKKDQKSRIMRLLAQVVIIMAGLSVYAACTACQHVFAERAEVSGIPESFCSYHKTMHRRGVLRRAGGTAAGVSQAADTEAGGDPAPVGKRALQRKNLW